LTEYTRFYQIADINIQVNSDLPIKDKTYHKKFETFRIEKPGNDIITIHHHFELPGIPEKEIGKLRYSKPPWVIYEQLDGWLYLGKLPDQMNQKYWTIAKFNQDHSEGHIYHPNAYGWERGGLVALTKFPTDQILLARVLAERQGFFLHSAGAILNGNGILFVGHSEAGKSTTTQMLLDLGKSNPEEYDVEILCDDRNIVRKKSDGWHVYGSWSHGDIPNVSANSAPLKTICFLEQAKMNALIPIDSKLLIYHQLLACVIRSFETDEWWEQTLNLVENLSKSIPCYCMRFDKSGEIIFLLNKELHYNG